MVHFGLVISILLFNLINMVQLSLQLAYQNACNTSLSIAYFAFAIDTWIWDIFELMLDLLLLYIVSASSDIGESEEFENNNQ